MIAAYSPWKTSTAGRPGHMPTAPARPLPDPAALSAAERRALVLLATGQPLYRALNGWGRPPRRVGIAVAESLMFLGLARRHNAGAQAPSLVLTGAGKTVASLIAERPRK